MRRLLLALALLCAPVSAYGQTTSAKVVSSCGAQSYSAGTTQQQSQDTTGKLCDSGGGGGGTVTANQGTPNAGGATNSWPVQGAGAAGTPAGGVVSVQGVASGTVVPISAGSLPLPTGAATSANQPTNAAQGSTTAAQTGNLVQGAVTTSAPSYTNAQTDPVSLTPAGNLRVDGSTVTQPVSNGGTFAVQAAQATATNLNATVVGTGTFAVQDNQATASNLNAQVVGNVAAGASDSGNGVKAAGVYNSTLPTLTNGLRGDLQIGTRGSLDTQACGANTATCAVVTNVNGDGLSASSAAIYEQAFGALWNGTTWDRAYSGGTTGSASVSGGVASAAADSGNPVKTGGVYTTSPSAVTTGQRVNLWLDQFGNPAAASYGGGEVPVSCSTGNVAAAIATCTMPAASGKTTYISGFDITASGATVGSVVTCTLTNTGSGTHSYTFAASAGALLSDTPLTKVFERPLAATATNTAPVLSCPSLGTGNTNMTINMDGFEK